MNGRSLLPDNIGEKTIVDYVAVLVRRWKLVTATFLLVLTVGLVVLSRRPPGAFPYTTVIDVGNVTPVDITSVKLRVEYITRALLEHASRFSYIDQRFTVDVTAPDEKTNILVLESSGSSESAADITGIHQKIVEYVLEDDAARLLLFRRDLEDEMFAAELQLTRLRDMRTSFADEKRRMESTTRLLESQLAELRRSIDRLDDQRATILVGEARQGTTDESRATVLLLIENDIQKNRDALRGIEERLSTTLPKERDLLKEREEENKKNVAEQERLIANLRFKIDHLAGARLLVPPSRLLRPSDQSMFATPLFVVLVGIVLAAMATFFAELAVNVQHLLRERRF